MKRIAEIKVFEVSEDEWIAAESAESASEFYRELVGQETYDEVTQEFGSPMELTPAMLDRLRFVDEETNRTLTFAQRLTELLASENQTYPQFFATGNL
jgi:hypothetical protein